MSSSDRPLSDEERAELEALRAERAAREAAAQVQRERAELELLKAESARAARERELEERDRLVRERNARLMEPDDDLNMPVGQKLVLLGIALAAALIVLMSLLSH